MAKVIFKSSNHQAYLVKIKMVKEIIYLLETCNPKDCAGMARTLKDSLESTEGDFKK